MTAKEYLSQAYHLDQRIRSKQEQIASLNDLATDCSVTLTGMPRNPNRGGSRMADAVCKIIDLENEIAKDMEQLVELKAEIITTIKAVECIDRNEHSEYYELLFFSLPLLLFMGTDTGRFGASFTKYT